MMGGRKGGIEGETRDEKIQGSAEWKYLVLANR